MYGRPIIDKFDQFKSITDLKSKYLKIDKNKETNVKKKRTLKIEF